MQIGKLTFTPVFQASELLAEPVKAMLEKMENANEIEVTEIDPTLSETAAFCEAYDVRPDEAANCVVLEAKRGERTWFAACVILGNARADVNGVARRALDAKKVSFAPMERAVAETGMEYGAITPIGLPADWTILIGKAVTKKNVIIGSGIRKSKIALPGRVLAFLPNAQVLENLAQQKPVS